MAQPRPKDASAEKDVPEDEDVAQIMADITERSARMVRDTLERAQTRKPDAKNARGLGMGMGDPLNIAQAFLAVGREMLADPAKMASAHMSLWQDYLKLGRNTAERMMGHETEPVIAPDPDDRRFKDAAWEDSAVFDFIKQSYLLTSRWAQDMVADVEGIDNQTARKAQFATREFMHALAPTNFVLTNPEVMRATIDSRGKNLVRGLRNLLEDLERGDGRLDIKMTDTDAFEIGRNMAVTPGKVIFQNELMELIQYDPATDKVRKAPLLIVPPWINKYYILDLNEKKSFVRWAVEQGHSVFIISWVNPGAELAEKGFDDYMTLGPLAALDAIEAATGEKAVNAIGYCLGGTLLSATLAWMAARKDTRIKSATFLTTLVDFKDVGEIGVFVDHEQVEALENRMTEKGYMEGGDMKSTFNMLRSNDLVWSFVVNNYLLGKDPFPFDLLYWNGDSTRMPIAMHSFYLREMYLANKLSQPGGLTIAGETIDLSKIKVPCYLLATREDHIAPWQSTFEAMSLYTGPRRFVLAASGHIAGVINPPKADKYGYWTNDRKPSTSDAWLEGADQHQGSWWPDWQAWVTPHAGQKTVKARKPGAGKLKPLYDAPGTYVTAT